MPGTRKLGRATDCRISMLRGLVTFLLENRRIETTLPRAKEVRAMAEKMITLAKQDTLHNRRLALAFITKESVVHELFTSIAPAYTTRNSGYTRIYRLGPRRGDAAEMAVIELIDPEEPPREKKSAAQPAKPAKKTEAAPKASAEQPAEEPAPAPAEESPAPEKAE